MLKAVARYLHGRDFPALGIGASAAIAPLVNVLPRGLRESVYRWSGWSEALPAGRLGRVRAEQITGWAVSQYPKRCYPAVAVGSSNGAAVHLWSALGVPWLPQTFLIPVRHPGLDVDDPPAAVEWAREPARALLDANADFELHHMHDPVQDALMLARMTYFRVKLLRLGEAYERFLAERLDPGGTIFVVDCRRRWPTTLVGERHVFQVGAMGGAEPDEVLRRWPAPRTDAERPEAEWGFAAALADDVERVAERSGLRVRRLAFVEPEHLSPLVAELYRWWYAQRRIESRRLLVESFILLEPYWTLRTGSVPFWTKFAVEPDAAWLERYLDEVDVYDDIRVMLFSHGVDSLGLAPIERWRAIIGRASRGGFVGVDERRFPRDFATFVRYHDELERLAPRYPLPGPLQLTELDRFLEEHSSRFRVDWAG
jgi:hypothetical protein